MSCFARSLVVALLLAALDVVTCLFKPVPLAFHSGPSSLLRLRAHGVRPSAGWRQRTTRVPLFAMIEPKEMLESYTALLLTAPYPTKIATASVLGAAGDLVAQIAEAASKEFDAKKWSFFQYDTMRGLSMVSFNAVYTGAFQSWWINTLQQNVHLPNPVADAAVKTGLCQFGTIPLIYMPTFFLITGAVRGMTLQASIDNGKAQYLRIYSRNVGFWIPVQMIQFFYVPQEWQIPFLCAAGFTWTVILSSLSLSAPRASAPAPLGLTSEGVRGMELTGNTQKEEQKEEEESLV